MRVPCTFASPNNSSTAELFKHSVPWSTPLSLPASLIITLITPSEHFFAPILTSNLLSHVHHSPYILTSFLPTLHFIVYHYITPLYILLTSLYLGPPAWQNPGSVQLDTPDKITELAVVTKFMIMNLQWALNTALCISLAGLLSHTLKWLHCTSIPKYPTPLPFLPLSWKLYFSFHWEK